MSTICKTQVAVDPQGRFLSVSESVPGGANHDLMLLRATRLLDELAPGAAAMMDKGYDGITKDYPGHSLQDRTPPCFCRTKRGATIR